MASRCASGDAQRNRVSQLNVVARERNVLDLPNVLESKEGHGSGLRRFMSLVDTGQGEAQPWV